SSVIFKEVTMLNRLLARRRRRLVRWLMPEIVEELAGRSRKFQGMPLYRAERREMLIFPRLTPEDFGHPQVLSTWKGWPRERRRRQLETPDAPSRDLESRQSTRVG